MRRVYLLHSLGGPIIVSRDKVQEEFKLSDDPKQQLLGEVVRLRSEIHEDLREAP